MRLTDEELLGMSTWPVDIEPDTVEMSHRKFQEIVAELRSRRAADLSEEEREALAQLRRDVEMEGCSNSDCTSCHKHRRALAVLDRLLGKGETR